MQLLDFVLSSGLIPHARPEMVSVRWGRGLLTPSFRPCLTATPLVFGCILPTAGWIRDLHPLERVPAGRTRKSEYHLFLDDTPVLNISYYSFYGSVPNTSWLILTCMYPSLTSIRFLKFIRYISVLISSRLILLLSSSFISLS